MSGAGAHSHGPLGAGFNAATSAHGPAAVAARVVELAFLARAVEVELERLALAGEVRVFQPARRAAWAQIAAALALGPEDHLFGTRRDWPAALGRGVPVTTLMRQFYGREGDPGGGRSLPGALYDAVRHISLSDGPPAAHLLHAVGFGIAAQVAPRGDRVALALLGAGVFGAGDLHAAFSLAPLRAARTLFVLRGPHGGEAGFAEALAAWGLHRVMVDADSGSAVYEAVTEARRRALAGDGPTLIDARHGEAEAVPGDVLALQAAGRLSSEAERAVGAEIRAALWVARQGAEAAARPSPETLLDHRRAPNPNDPPDPNGPTELADANGPDGPRGPNDEEVPT